MCFACTVHGKVLKTEKLVNLTKHEVFIKISSPIFMNTPKLHLTYALTSLFAKFIFTNSFYLYGSLKFTYVWYVYVSVHM